MFNAVEEVFYIVRGGLAVWEYVRDVVVDFRRWLGNVDFSVWFRTVPRLTVSNTFNMSSAIMMVLSCGLIMFMLF